MPKQSNACDVCGKSFSQKSKLIRHSRQHSKDKSSTRKSPNPSMSDRANPKLRGVHPDAIQACPAPSSRSTCVDCGNPIAKGTVRWGIKYAGNPLTGVGLGVIPLYGSHPMVMWCHSGGCGLRYKRGSAMQDACDAARTCHLCSDQPDDAAEQSSIKLLCGGTPKGGKIRQHAFHIGCFSRAIQLSPAIDESGKHSILIDASEIGGWTDLTSDERHQVQKQWENCVKPKR